MTIEQMAQALKSVGACFAVTTAKTVLVSDPHGTKPSYHIHPDASDPRQDSIKRLASQKQLMDWVRTAKAAARCTDDFQAVILWNEYAERWS